MFKKLKNVILWLLCSLVLLYIPFTSAMAASNLNLYYYGTKQNVSYTGKQVKYNYNGTSINMNGTPGILVDGTSMAPFIEVFVKSKFNMSYKYNESKGTITLSQNGNVLSLKLGSKKATFNGKSVSSSVAPMKVKYKDKKVAKILVPTRFITELFGYTYEYNSSTSSVSITAPMKLNYNNKNIIYSGTKGKVTVDGESINLGSMPSIIINQTAMLRAYQVFATSSIGADYSFNKSTQVLTLAKDDIVVKLTMGNKTADVNGKPRTMDTAPVLVTNLDTNDSYVMVPGSFVASYLGYDYTWNSSTKTSVITTRQPDEENNDDNNDGPELGGDPAPDSTSFNWGIKDQFKNDYAKVSNLTTATEVGASESTTAVINVVQKDLTDTNKEVYSIHSATPFSKSSVAKLNQLLTVHITNSVLSTSSNLSGSFVTMVNSTSNSSDISSDITFQLTNANLNYELSLSSDKCTLYLTVYQNYLTGITAGVKSGSEFVSLTGIAPFTVNISESGNYLTLQISDIVNGVGDNYLETALTSLHSVQSTTINNTSMTVVLEKSETSKYQVSQSGNTYQITFTDNAPVVNTDKYAMEIKIPNGLSYSDISNEDRYYKNQIAILMPGDYRSFYSTNSINWNNSVVKDVSVNYKNSKTEIVISTSRLQGYKLTDLGTKIGVVLGNPRDIYKNIVVLDAGHGGTDPGAMRSLNGVTIREKDLNFTMMYKLTQKYFNAENSEIKAYYSRYDDTKIDLYERAAYAKKVGADLFVSLHMNANNSSSPKGTEIYYTGSNNSPAENGLTSKALANIFLNSLPNRVGTQKRYIADKSLAVTRANTVPAILVELGFMSNKSDLQLLTDSSFQENTAEAIYDILCEVFNAYPTGR